MNQGFIGPVNVTTFTWNVELRGMFPRGSVLLFYKFRGIRSNVELRGMFPRGSEFRNL